MFNNNQFPPVNVLILVDVEPAVKWLADNDHEAASTALSECGDFHYVYPDSSKMFVTIERLRVIIEEPVILQMNAVVAFTNVGEDHVFTPFTELVDTQVERVESTGSLF